MKRFVLLLIFLAGCSVPMQEICTPNSCIPIEIADTPKKQAQGLMDRDFLEGGMLFPHNKEKNLTFWMKNMKIPLDIVWMDENLQVLKILKNVPPCTTDPCPLYQGYGQYVLEINAGVAEEREIVVGSKASRK